jgi:hypothetical protein
MRRSRFRQAISAGYRLGPAPGQRPCVGAVAVLLTPAEPSGRIGGSWPGFSSRNTAIRIAKVSHSAQSDRLRPAKNDFCQIGDAMPEEHRSFIEGECLRVARSQPGCGHLRAIAIARTDAPNRKPNWEVLGFDPELSPSMRSQAIEAIEIVRGQYVLTPYVKPERGKAFYREAMRVELKAAPVRGDES